MQCITCVTTHPQAYLTHPLNPPTQPTHSTHPSRPGVPRVRIMFPKGRVKTMYDY